MKSRVNMNQHYDEKISKQSQQIDLDLPNRRKAQQDEFSQIGLVFCAHRCLFLSKHQHKQSNQKLSMMENQILKAKISLEEQMYLIEKNFWKNLRCLIFLKFPSLILTEAIWKRMLTYYVDLKKYEEFCLQQKSQVFLFSSLLFRQQILTFISSRSRTNNYLFLCVSKGSFNILPSRKGILRNHLDHVIIHSPGPFLNSLLYQRIKA